DERSVIWNAQRMFNGNRQIITVTLSVPAKNYILHHDQLYEMLRSIKFAQDNNLSQAEPTVNDSPVIVSCPNDNEIYLGKRRIGRTELTREIDRMLRDLPQEKQVLYIKAAPDVSYSTIVSIMDDMDSFGYEKVGLISTNPPAQPAPAKR